MSDCYIGTELELFAGAHRWKAYVAATLKPYIGKRVLEVGGGIGSNIAYLHGAGVEEWISVEPDAGQAAQIARRISGGKLPANCRVLRGTIDAVEAGARYDTVLYIDVLEHIEADRDELAHAAQHLAAGGALVVLAPAHQFLFSPFDRAIGHFRRYGLAELAALTPPGCGLVRLLMLDAAGFFASLANRFLLSSAMPTPRQIAFWDNVLVPISRWLDPLTFHRFGKTAIAVWRAAA